MKKLICALMCAVMLLGLAPSVFALKNGDVVDAVLHTDIVTYINGTPIESYNIKGYTAVKVEDLMNYGFMVVWDAGARTLKVTRPVVRPVTSTYVPVANTYIVGSYWMDVYYTDIKTYFNGNEVPSYNIGGSTIAYVDDLAKYFTTPDKYIWDGSARTLSLTLPGETSGSGSGSSTAQPTPTTTPASPLKITSQPVSVTAKANDTVKFSVAVSGGEGTITYKWERRAPTETTWTAAGGTGADYSFTATQDVLDAGYVYRCVVTDGKGNSVTSNEVQLISALVMNPVKIVTQPVSQSADQLFKVLSFSVQATGGSGSYTYAWQTSKDGVNWSPAAGISNLQTYSVTVIGDMVSSVSYVRCIVYDAANSALFAVSDYAAIVGLGSTQPQTVTKSTSTNRKVGESVYTEYPFANWDIPSGSVSYDPTVTTLNDYGLGLEYTSDHVLLKGIPSKAGTAFLRMIIESGNTTYYFEITVNITSAASSSGGTSSGNISASIPASVKTTVGVGFSGKIVVTVTNGSGDYSYEWHVKKGSDDWFISADKDNDYDLPDSAIDDTSTWTVYCVVTDNKDTSKKISTNTCYVYVSAASSGGSSSVITKTADAYRTVGEQVNTSYKYSNWNIPAGSTTMDVSASNLNEYGLSAYYTAYEVTIKGKATKAGDALCRMVITSGGQTYYFDIVFHISAT